MKYWFILFMLVFSAFSVKAQLYVNEVQASNQTTLADNFLEHDDWIEIYNTSNNSVNLANYYLSDDRTNLTKFQIPSTNNSITTIPANGYLLFWADDDSHQGENHCNFKLSSGGETIFLSKPDGITLIDSLQYAAISTDITFKRIPDGSNNLVTSAIASPLATNNNDFGLLESPVYSITSGVFNSSQTLTLTATNGATIYYTTDSSEPNQQSNIYNTPINISQNTSIKSLAVKNGFTNSEVVSHTYLINTNHNLPIITINIDDDYLYSDSQGMLVEGTNGTVNPHGICNNVVANYWQEWEYPGNVVYFDENGNEAFNIDGGISVFGNCSRKYAQKNIAVKTKNLYPSPNIPYKIFPTSDQDEFRRVRLRNGGDHWETSMMGDLIFHSLVENKIDIEVQSGYPAASYFNGVYQGLYNLRNAYSKHYLRYKFDKYKNSDFDIIRMEWKHNAVVPVDGDSIGINKLFDLFDPSVTFTSAIIDSIYNTIDVNNFINYFVASMWVYADDWPSTTSPSNLIYWKPKEAGTKWRVALLDSDEGWLVSNHDTYTYLLHPGSQSSRHGEKSTRFIRRLIQDIPQFREEFIQRAFTYYNILFHKDTIKQKIVAYKNLINNEMYAHANLWGGEDYSVDSHSDWEDEVDDLINYSNVRSDRLKEHIADYNNESTTNLSFSVNNNSNGAVAVNSNFFKVPNNYVGEYVEDIPIWIHGIPKPGFRFVEWQGIGIGSHKYQQSLYKSYGNSTTIIPIFEPALDIVINEIHYNPLGLNEEEEFIELYNPDDKAKPLYGYQFNNGVEFTFPENAVINPDEYIIIAKDASVYAGNNYQVFQWECGSLNNDGEMVFFSNPINEVIDSVRYNDNIDWSQEADGLGYSLALIDANQDNYQPFAWASQGTAQITPGLKNDFCSPMQINQQKADVSCNGLTDGFISINMNGGTVPYTYSWSNGATGSIAQNLAQGNYSVTVRDFYACEIVKNFQISEPPVLNATININDASSTNPDSGSIVLTTFGGTAPYTFNWSNGATSQNIYNLIVGNYTLSLADTNGCSKTFNQLVLNTICEPLLIQQNNLAVATQIYQVKQFIRSNGIVHNNRQTSFKAGDYIELINNFEVKQGAEFEARIEGCQ